MKKLLILVASVGMIAGSCRKIEVDGGTTIVTHQLHPYRKYYPGRKDHYESYIESAYTYKLRGLVYVTSGAILTIEPGTKIVGENGKNGALIITRGAKIIADGTRR
jgi:hypothetical protein